MRNTLDRSRAIAVWSAFRHTARQLVRKAKPARVGIASLMSIVAAALCAPQSAQAATVIATIGGNTTGTDRTGVFGYAPGTTFNTTFTVVFTIDDTKGVQGNYPNNGYSGGTYIQNSGLSNPITAVLTINGKSLSFGTSPTLSVTSYAQRYVDLTSTPGDQLYFYLADSLNPSGEDVISIGIDSASTLFTTDYNWEAPFFYTAITFSSTTSFNFLYGNQAALGYLTPTSITITAPQTPQIYASDTEITGNTLRGVVGQPVFLSATPAGQTSSWVLFNEGGTQIPWAQVAAGGYVSPPPWENCPKTLLTKLPNPLPTCIGEIQTLTNANFLSATAPPFYWAVPGTYIITYQYTTSKGVNGQAAFFDDTEGPTSAYITPSYYYTVTPSLTGNNLYLDFEGLEYINPPGEITYAPSPSGCIANPPSLYCFGIGFTPSATLPLDYNGQYFWVQLIGNQTLTFVESSGAQQSKTCTAGLDNTFPYGAVIPSKAIAYDAPGLTINVSNLLSVTWNFTADMYLMWEATSDLSGNPVSALPVPLGYVAWGFKATAALKNGAWVLSSYTPLQDGFTFTASSNFEDATAFPQWQTVSYNAALGGCE